MLVADERQTGTLPWPLQALPNPPSPPSPKAWAAGTLLHPTTMREDGAQALGSVQLSWWDLYPWVPTIVQPFLKLTADESPATAWPQRASLIKIPASSPSPWKPPRPPTNERGARGGFVVGLVWYSVTKPSRCLSNLNWLYNCFKLMQLCTASNCIGGKDHRSLLRHSYS